MEIKDNEIVISPLIDPKRKGWDRAFEEMAKNGDDNLFIPDAFEDEEFPAKSLQFLCHFFIR